jgi:hypothetical protein
MRYRLSLSSGCKLKGLGVLKVLSRHPLFIPNGALSGQLKPDGDFDDAFYLFAVYHGRREFPCLDSGDCRFVKSGITGRFNYFHLGDGSIFGYFH